MTIGELCEFKVNFPDADFWLIRRGSEDAVGKPVNEFNPENIGVKVIATDVLDPRYLYYVFLHLHGQGVFVQMAHGTLRLKNIKISDIKNIPIG